MSDSGNAKATSAVSPRNTRPPTEGTPTLAGDTDALASPLTERVLDDRYDVAGVLGEGAMGEVWLCEDRLLERPVAVKCIRDEAFASTSLRARFERETAIQGQLDHPGVVPVHDRGERADGVPFIAMKHVRGHTLASILDGLRDEDPATMAAFPLERLLSDLARICLTMAFAHSKGVVHRDLKPSNIMLGDFGETYVLDWGIAKLATPPTDDDPRDATSSASAPAGADIITRPVHTIHSLEAPDGSTEPGTALGTPSYMAPEQVLSAGEAEPQTDVFALGAILFEVVTLERLNRGQTAQEAMRHAILDPEPRIRASMQQRGVSPALASLCIAATHFEVEARLPSARELGARIDAFLRGNQTRADRQELARRHRLNAQLALADAELSQDDAAQASIRGVRELNKALVLDPRDLGSLASLSKVFSEAGRLLPAEGEAALAERRTEARRNSARAAAVAAAGTLCVQALLLNAQVLAWSALLPIIALNLLWPLHIALTVKFNWLGKRDYIITAGLAGALCASYAALFGPLVFVPTLVVAFMLPLIVDSRADLQLRWIIVAVGLAAAIGVTGLGALGLFPLPYEFRDGRILIRPTAVAFDPVWVYLLLIVGVVLCVAIPAVLLGRMVDTLNQTERELFARAWMLEEMLAGSDPTTNDAVEPHGEKRADERDG